VPGKNGFARSLPKAFSFGKTISSIFPFSILCSDDCRLCEFHCCGSRVCSNKIVLGFYLVEFLDSAVLVIEFMAPPTIQKVKDGVGIYLLCSLLIVVPWYSGCQILIGKSTVIPCFCNGLSSLKSRKIRISKNFCVPFSLKRKPYHFWAAVTISISGT
jgi:hypothetical protein